MLRKVNSSSVCPSLPIEPFVQKEPIKVKYNVTNPDTGEVVGTKSDVVVKSTPISPASEVRNDTAEMYSIQNLLEAGIQPTECNGTYISTDCTTFNERMVKMAIDQKVDELSEVPATSTSEQKVESPKPAE